MEGKMFTLEDQIASEKKNNVVRQLHQTLRARLTAEDWHKFEEQKTDFGRIQVLLEIGREEIQACADNKAKLHAMGKNKTTAMTLKDAGNKAFGTGNNTKALQLYSECIALMPHDESKDVSVVYANRSASLFHLEEFSLALQDAEIAFGLNYPEELHYKLHERAGRACLQLGKRPAATKHFQKALQALIHAKGLDETRMSKIKTTLENLLKTCPSSQNNSSSVTGNNTEANAMSLPEIAGGRGHYLRNAAKRLAVHYNESDGRYIVAKEDIRPGEVILVEKAYVSTLTQEYCHKQCFQCFAQIRAPIFCTNCSVVSFCSLKCRDLAWKTHHRYECTILGFLHRSGISIICFMAVRILTQANPRELLSWYDLANETEERERRNQEIEDSKNNIIEECSKEKAKEDRELDGEYRTDHFHLFDLVSHSGRRSVEDNFHRALMTLYLLSALKRTSLFTDILKGAQLRDNKEKNKKSSTGEPSKEITVEMIELKLGTLLFRSLKFLQFNPHEISGWDSERAKSVFLGGGVFPSLALFNHSCTPALVRYFVNDTVVVSAIRTIYRGEQVTENYGPVFTTKSEEERKFTLQDVYWFDCQCVACTLHWPTFDQMPLENELSFRCGHCRRFLCKMSADSMSFLLRCSICSRTTNILKSLKSLHESEARHKQGLDFMNNGRMETGLGILLETIELFDSVLVPPFRDYHLCQEAVRKCLLQRGNQVSPYDKITVPEEDEAPAEKSKVL